MVIEPKETRPRIITALNMLASKREVRPAKNMVMFHYNRRREF